MRYDVKLWHGTYTKTVSVNASEDDDNETIIARAKARAKREGFYCLSMAYEREEIVGRDDD